MKERCGQGQSSEVAPGDAGSQGGEVKSGLLSCELCGRALHCPVPSLVPLTRSTASASCEDHSTFLLWVGREYDGPLATVTEQIPEHFIWHMEGTECQRGFYCT